MFPDDSLPLSGTYHLQQRRTFDSEWLNESSSTRERPVGLRHPLSNVSPTTTPTSWTRYFTRRGGGGSGHRRVGCLAVMTLCMVLLTTTRMLSRYQCDSNPALCGVRAPPYKHVAQRPIPRPQADDPISELSAEPLHRRVSVVNHQPAVKISEWTGADDGRRRSPRGNSGAHRTQGDIVADNTTTGASAASADHFTDPSNRSSMNLHPRTYSLIPRGLPRTGKDEHLMSQRWPTSGFGQPSARRKRRFHRLSRHHSTPEELNALWQCPEHRARSPTGFIPGARLYPIDSITAVLTAKVANELAAVRGAEEGPPQRRGSNDKLLRVTHDPRFAEALVSRDDLDSSPFHRYIDRSHASQSSFSFEADLSQRLEMRECLPTSRLSDTVVGDSPLVRAAPLQVDVVFTYVNGTAPSFINGLKLRNLSYDPHRFHDWDELKYALRSIYMRAVCAHDPPFILEAMKPRQRRQGGEDNDVEGTSRGRQGHIVCEEGSFVRKIFLVVAARDQIPVWLNASHELIHIVEHRDIFPSHDFVFGHRHHRTTASSSSLNSSSYLPTFNSHAIELHLHRIPGLSRFFIYLNNDMMFGRRISLLDYFRPISASRQALRSKYGTSFDIPQDSGASTPNDGDVNSVDIGGCHETVTSSAYGLFEPIIYGEAEARSCTPRRRKGASEALRHALAQDLKVQQGEGAAAPPRCGSHPIRPSALFDLECFYPSRAVIVDPMMKKTHFNWRLAFDRLDGVAVTHTFPHFPQLFDRLLLQRMIDVDFEDVAETTRRSFDRTDQDLWVTLLYSTYALAHRQAVETRLENKAMTAKHMRIAKLSKHNNEAAATTNGVDHSYSQTAAATQFEAWAVATLADHGTLDQTELDDGATRGLLSMLGRHFFTTDDWLPHHHWRFQFTTTEPTGEGAAVLWKDTLNRTQTFNMSWMGPDALLACSKRPTCTSVAREKLFHHVVTFFDKLSSYRFCMLKNRRAATACARDVFLSSSGGGTRLFWALNDDWQIVDDVAVDASPEPSQRNRMSKKRGRSGATRDSRERPSNASAEALTSHNEGGAVRTHKRTTATHAESDGSAQPKDALPLPLAIMRRLQQLPTDDDAAAAQQHQQQHRRVWAALKKRVVHSRNISAGREDEQQQQRRLLAEQDMERQLRRRRHRGDDADANGNDGDGTDWNDLDPTLPPRQRRRMLFARSRSVTQGEAAMLSQAIMHGITRNAGMAPWEFPAAASGSRAVDGTAKPQYEGASAVITSASRRDTTSSPASKDHHLEELFLRSLGASYGPMELSNAKLREDVASFLREEYRRDRVSSKDDWLWNPLNL